jgi:hypothetical protein
MGAASNDLNGHAVTLRNFGFAMWLKSPQGEKNERIVLRLTLGCL